MDRAALTRGVLGRREFMARAGWAGVGALGLTGGRVGPLAVRPAHAASGVREIQLETRAVKWELAPGRTIEAMAYNGRVPGPEIRLRYCSSLYGVHLQRSVPSPE